MNLETYYAIDPMALILSGSAYLKWVEKHHPNGPPFEDLGAVLKPLSEDQKRFALARARMFKAYGDAVIGALEGKQQVRAA